MSPGRGARSLLRRVEWASWAHFRRRCFSAPPASVERFRHPPAGPETRYRVSLRTNAPRGTGHPSDQRMVVRTTCVDGPPSETRALPLEKVWRPASLSAAGLELAKLPFRNEKRASEHENVSKMTENPECWAHCGAASTPGTKIPIPAVTHESNGPKNQSWPGGKAYAGNREHRADERPQPDTTQTDPRIERRPRRAHATPGPCHRHPSRPSALDTDFG